METCLRLQSQEQKSELSAFAEHSTHKAKVVIINVRGFRLMGVVNR